MNPNIPAMVENHLDAIDFTTGGKLILGSSNLTGRYWNGSLWCFKSVDDAPDVEKCCTGFEISAGICDLVCFDESSVAVGLDSGSLEVYKLEEEPEQFICNFGVCEHDDSISSLSLNSDKSSLISVGFDKCVKIWNLKSMATTATYRPIHGGIIWQVSCSTTDPNLFVTCGQDGKIILFDVRLPKPASLIDSNPLKGCPTSVCWKPLSDNLFAVGDESGLVAMKDVRQAGSLCSWDAHKRRIFRMSFSKSQLCLATCADDTDVCITNVEGDNALILCRSNIHEDFVRGLVWSPKNDDLISCGWDKKVLKHTFNKTSA